MVAMGSVDEINSFIGAALALPVDSAIRKVLTRVQQELFNLGGSLAVREERGGLVKECAVTELESAIATWNAALPPLREFVLPGGSPASAALHVARSVCRRAERDLVMLNGREPIEPIHLRFLNRLSDLLFVAARFQQARDGTPEEQWSR